MSKHSNWKMVAFTVTAICFCASATGCGSSKENSTEETTLAIMAEQGAYEESISEAEEETLNISKQVTVAPKSTTATTKTTITTATTNGKNVVSGTNVTAVHSRSTRSATSSSGSSSNNSSSSNNVAYKSYSENTSKTTQPVSNTPSQSVKKATAAPASTAKATTKTTAKTTTKTTVAPKATEPVKKTTVKTTQATTKITSKSTTTVKPITVTKPITTTKTTVAPQPVITTKATTTITVPETTVTTTTEPIVTTVPFTTEEPTTEVTTSNTDIVITDTTVSSTEQESTTTTTVPEETTEQVSTTVIKVEKNVSEEVDLSYALVNGEEFHLDGKTSVADYVKLAKMKLALGNSYHDSDLMQFKGYMYESTEDIDNDKKTKVSLEAVNKDGKIIISDDELKNTPEECFIHGIHTSAFFTGEDFTVEFANGLKIGQTQSEIIEKFGEGKVIDDVLLGKISIYNNGTNSLFIIYEKKNNEYIADRIYMFIN